LALQLPPPGRCPAELAALPAAVAHLSMAAPCRRRPPPLSGPCGCRGLEAPRRYL